MKTPSEIYYTFGDAVADFLALDFKTETAKKGREKGIADGMTLSMPIVIQNHQLRYSSAGSVEMTLLVTAENRYNILQSLDAVVEWIKANRNGLGFELLLDEANPYYMGDETSPQLVGYQFDVICNV